MKRTFTRSWLTVVLFTAILGAPFGCAVPTPEDEPAVVEDSSELEACLPRGTELGGGGICNGTGGSVFVEPDCCSGRGRVRCLRGEPSESFCI